MGKLNKSIIAYLIFNSLSFIACDNSTENEVFDMAESSSSKVEVEVVEMTEAPSSKEDNTKYKNTKSSSFFDYKVQAGETFEIELKYSNYQNKGTISWTLDNGKDLADKVHLIEIQETTEYIPPVNILTQRFILQGMTEGFYNLKFSTKDMGTYRNFIFGPNVYKKEYKVLILNDKKNTTTKTVKIK